MSRYVIGDQIRIYQQSQDREIEIQVHSIEYDSDNPRENELPISRYLGRDMSELDGLIYIFDDDDVIEDTIHPQPLESDGLMERIRVSLRNTINNPRPTYSFTSSTDTVFPGINTGTIQPIAVDGSRIRRPARPIRRAIIHYESFPGLLFMNSITARQRGLGVASQHFNPTFNEINYLSFTVLPISLGERRRDLRPDYPGSITLTPTHRNLTTSRIAFSDPAGRIWYNSIGYPTIDRMPKGTASNMFIDMHGIHWMKADDYWDEFYSDRAESRGYPRPKKNIRKKYGEMPQIKSEDHYEGKEFIA